MQALHVLAVPAPCCLLSCFSMCAPLCCVGFALQEDSSVTEKRAAVRDLYDKIKMAIDDVQYKQEKIKRKDHEGDNVRAAVHTCMRAVQRCAVCLLFAVLAQLQHWLLRRGQHGKAHVAWHTPFWLCKHLVQARTSRQCTRLGSNQARRFMPLGRVG